MKPEAIESFVYIIHHQTISAAAEALFVSQSTISHRIQVLEEELGVKLFLRDRGFKKLELTEEGKKFYPLALQWLELNSNMSHIKSASSLGKVRIGSMDSMNQFLLSPLISQIQDDLPNLQMEFVTYHSREIYNKLTSHQLDIGFAFSPAHYDIIATPVFDEPVYMISLPESSYPAGEVHPFQLNKRDQILFPWDENIIQWNNEWWDEQIPPFVRVDSCGLLMTFMKNPNNWALCPASVATSLRAQYNIKINLFSEAPPHRMCYLLQRKSQRHAAPSKAVESFVDCFYKTIKKHPWRYSKLRQGSQGD